MNENVTLTLTVAQVKQILGWAESSTEGFCYGPPSQQEEEVIARYNATRAQLEGAV